MRVVACRIKLCKLFRRDCMKRMPLWRENRRATNRCRLEWGQRGSVFFFNIFIYLFIWLHWVWVVTCEIFRCGVWDLVPWLGIEPGPPVLGGQSLSHWTTREVLRLCVEGVWGCASCVYEILQVRILEWVAISFSRGSSQPRDQTQVSCIAGRFFTIWATWEAPKCL